MLARIVHEKEWRTTWNSLEARVFKPYIQGGFAVTVCTRSVFEFPVCNRRRFQASFTGGHVSGDGGVLLLRQVDRCLGLTQASVRALPDARRQAVLPRAVLPLSATTTSPAMSCSRKAARPSAMHIPSELASLRQGITTDTSISWSLDT